MDSQINDRIKLVLGIACFEAQHYERQSVGPEHILWGLLKEDRGVTRQLLDSMKVDIQGLRQEVEQSFGQRLSMPSFAKPPLTPEAKAVIACASEEAAWLDDETVGTEHLILALARAGDSIAAQLLAKLGLRPDNVREEILKVLFRYPPQPRIK